MLHLGHLDVPEIAAHLRRPLFQLVSTFSRGLKSDTDTRTASGSLDTQSVQSRKYTAGCVHEGMAGLDRRPRAVI